MLKGKLVVGQSGGPTPVINASLAGVIQEALQHPMFEAVYGMVLGIEGALYENFIDLSRELPDTIETLRQTPASALGSCRHKVSEGGVRAHPAGLSSPQHPLLCLHRRERLDGYLLPDLPTSRIDPLRYAGDWGA